MIRNELVGGRSDGWQFNTESPYAYLWAYGSAGISDQASIGFCSVSIVRPNDFYQRYLFDSINNLGIRIFKLDHNE